MKKLDARTKFMIADLFELRARKWKPRRDEKAPATIAQVRQQAAQEELNKRSASKNNLRSGHSKSHDRSSHNRGGSERRGGSFNMPTVFSSSSSSKKVVVVRIIAIRGEGNNRNRAIVDTQQQIIGFETQSSTSTRLKNDEKTTR